MSLAHALKKLGFTDKKAAVYIALLENGESSASEISKTTKIQRTTVYDVLKELEKSRLISAAHGRKEKKTFIVEEPERLEELVEISAQRLAQQKLQLETQQSELKNIIPQLRTINNKISGKARVQYYDSAKGLVDALNDCLIKKQPVHIYGSLDPWRRWMPDHFDWYADEVEKRKIDVKRIDQKTIDKMRGMESEETVSSWPVKYLTVGFTLSGFSLLYGDKLLLPTFQKPTATILTDKEYVLTQITVFQMMWQFLREE